MATIIENDGLSIKITKDGIVSSYAKIATSVFVKGDLVYIYDAPGQSIVLDYTDVTNLSVSSAEELREEIVKIKNTWSTLNLLEIARRNIPGTDSIHKFGRNPIVQTTREDVWDGGGIWIPPTQSRIHDITSTDVDDVGSLVSSGTATDGSTTTLVDTGATFQSDGVAVGDILINDTQTSHGIISSVESETQVTVDIAMRGSVANESGDSYRIATAADTGAAVIEVCGLDSGYNTSREYVILNGTSNVATSSSFRMINRMVVRLAGVTQSNEGNITATAQTDGTLTAQININNNQTLMAVYQVPAGATGYLYAWKYSLNSSGTGANVITADFRLLAKPYGEVFQIKQIGGLVSRGTSSFKEQFDVQLDGSSFAEKAIIKIDAIAGDIDADVSASFDLVLIDN